MGSNISRDHIAMEAMKILLEKTVTKHLTLRNRIRKFLGRDYDANVKFDSETIAKISYKLTDAMIAQREKIGEDNV